MAQRSPIENMGFLSQFKAQRGLPRLTPVKGPGFMLWSYPAMRRLATLVGTADFLTLQSNILTLYIPANWWADGHEVIWRFYFTWNDFGGTAPPGNTISERCIDQTSNVNLTMTFTPPAIAVNLVQGCISRRMIRQGSNILFWDDEFSQGQFGIPNVVQQQRGIILSAPTSGWDFSQEIALQWQCYPAPATYPTTITVDNAIALIAPPLNLRT